MTHNTEQERAEFEAWCDSNEYDRVTRLDGSGYNNEKTKRAWAAWQAARRAPAAPAPQGVMDAVFTVIEGWTLPHQARKILETAYYAAPQPPEAGCSVSNGETQAAPVELPEPVAWRDPTNLSTEQSCTYQKWKRESWPHIYTQALYTEQQVRELLENHGIKVNQ